MVKQMPPALEAEQMSKPLLKDFPISEQAQECLKKFGWSEDRAISLEDTYPELFRKVRTDKRFTELFSKTPKLKPLLKNLCGISISLPDRKTRFGLEYNDYDSYEYEEEGLFAIKLLRRRTGNRFLFLGWHTYFLHPYSELRCALEKPLYKDYEGHDFYSRTIFVSFLLVIDKEDYTINALNNEAEYSYMYLLGSIQEALNTLLFDMPLILTCKRINILD